MYTWQHWVNLILGLWIILSSFIQFSSISMATNLTVTGLIIAAVALWGGLEHESHNEPEHLHA